MSNFPWQGWAQLRQALADALEKQAEPYSLIFRQHVSGSQSVGFVAQGMGPGLAGAGEADLLTIAGKWVASPTSPLYPRNADVRWCS